MVSVQISWEQALIKLKHSKALHLFSLFCLFLQGVYVHKSIFQLPSNPSR